jgi:hypothetical protein
VTPHQPPALDPIYQRAPARVAYDLGYWRGVWAERDRQLERILGPCDDTTDQEEDPMLSTKATITQVAHRLHDAALAGTGESIEELAQQGNRDGFAFTLHESGTGPGVETRYTGVRLTPDDLAAAVAKAQAMLNDPTA